MDFDEIAEQAGCDMSAMDGRVYETMWCDRAQFEKLCAGIAAIIEKRTIERCAVDLEDKVAEAIAAMCDASIPPWEQRRHGTTEVEDKVLQIIEAIRSGEWRKFVKGE